MDGCRGFADKAQFKHYTDKAFAAFDLLESGKGEGNDFLGWNNLPSQTSGQLIDQCNAAAAEWAAKGVDLVVVIGIGGSYLGAKATVAALTHSFAPLAGKKGMQVVFAGNTLSEDYAAELNDLMEVRNVAAVVISKSGTTTEPAVSFRLVRKFIEDKYGISEASKRIIAVTDEKRGALKTLSNAEGYKSFVIADNVGGRFSVLTPVGLVPVALAGLDISKLIEGAREMQKVCSERSVDNPAIQYAAMRNLLYDNGKKIEMLVSFTPKLQYVGEWWKQLYGESEGKDGKGIFPASATFTTDLHSMGQYIQSGERTLFETVVSVGKVDRSVVVTNDADNLDGLNFLTGKHLEACNDMARLGTKLAHIDGGVPNIEIIMPELDEFSLGGLFYFFEKACGISAYMLGINPFNQPGVEAYKKNMFALLGKPGFEVQAEELRRKLNS